MIKPLRNQIFLEKIEVTGENKTESGIIISSPKEQPDIGKVVYIGKKVEEVKKGDKVLYKKYGVEEVKLKGKTYLVGDEEDIIAVL